MRHLVRNAVLVLVIVLIAIASIYPPSKKLRLGKDLQGGFNVVYQVDVGSDYAGREATLDKVIQVVKERLDPNGLLDISIVKSGSDRIEITMPLPGEESKKLRAGFEAEMQKLVTGTLDRQALDRALALPAPERDKEMERLAGGSAERLAKFQDAAAAYDAYKTANDAYEAAAKKMNELQANLKQAKDNVAELGEDYVKLLEDGVKAHELIATPLANAANTAEDNYNAKAQAVLATVISRDEVEHALTRRAGVIRVPNPDNADDPLVLPSPRQEAINSLIEHHPEAADQIRKVAADWDTIEKNVKINDPNDLIRLLEGSGVLNFRITVNPGELGAQEKELRDQLHKVGPLNARTEQARWFKINKIENWFKTKAEYDQLRADPAGYLTHRQGVIGEEFDGDYYMLCWDKKGYRLTERDGAKWQLTSAYPSTDRIGRKCIAFNMDVVGAQLLGELTSNNVGRQMAVLLDDEVYTAPTINSQISNGGIIEGNFSDQEINYITRVLSHGSLAAKLSKKPISQDIIAPDKGIDNLRRGLTSGLIAFVICSGFMIVYYFGCGFLSVIALLLNALMCVAVMAIQGAPFTLPGIAGIVLVFGMAVDANVLIYERMREELQHGHDLKTAVRLGYEKALSSIVDGNLTTLIVCVVLGFTGTQEIKGFGITLGIGNVMTLFTQLFITRLAFAWLVEKTGWWRKASMLPIKVPAIDRALSLHVDWMRYRWVFAGFSIALTGLCFVLVAVKGSDMLDSQFRGGTKVTVKLKETSPGVRIEKSREEIQAEVEKVAAANPADPILNNLQHAPIILKNPDPNNPSLSSEFQFKTTLSDPDTVQKGIIKALGPLLDAQPELKFAGSEIQEPRLAPVYPIVDATLANNEGLEKFGIQEKVIDYLGGAAIVLENIQPPVSIESIDARIRQFRSQPDFSDTAGRQQKVIRLSGTDVAATGAVILVKDSSISSYEGNDRKWAEQLRNNEWKLVHTALTQTTTLASVESFSAEIAATFRAQAIIAVLLSTVLVIIYVWVRFGSFRYSAASIVTTLHDCVVSVGVIAMAEVLYDNAPGLASALGIMPFKFDLNILAAVLTVLGYSINDTIIVMDRIRETKGKLHNANRRIINDSINKTISRTVITSGTTLLAAFVLYLYGGEAVRGFAYSLTAGVLVGTYSSIAVAAPLVWKEEHETPTLHGPGHATGRSTAASAEKQEAERKKLAPA
jgi:SecD/SecF fusion protein